MPGPSLEPLPGPATAEIAPADLDSAAGPGRSSARGVSLSDDAPPNSSGLPAASRRRRHRCRVQPARPGRRYRRAGHRRRVRLSPSESAEAVAAGPEGRDGRGFWRRRGSRCRLRRRTGSCSSGAPPPPPSSSSPSSSSSGRPAVARLQRSSTGAVRRPEWPGQVGPGLGRLLGPVPPPRPP
jgi:hypothetical protein